MVFRLNGIHFTLTYPRCPIEPATALALLSDIIDIELYCISQESHRDGTPHLHAYLKAKRTYNIKSQRRFNLTWEGKEYHGNYQITKDVKDWIHYVKEEGNFIQNLTTGHTNEDIFDACRSMDPQDFLRLCLKRKIPKGYYDEVKRMCMDTFTVEDAELPHGNPTYTN